MTQDNDNLIEVDFKKLLAGHDQGKVCPVCDEVHDPQEEAEVLEVLALAEKRAPGTLEILDRYNGTEQMGLTNAVLDHMFGILMDSSVDYELMMASTMMAAQTMRYHWEKTNADTTPPVS